MSIRWVRNVQIDGQQSTLEILLGANRIADKCYIRINGENEIWFSPKGHSREEILSQGIELLKKQIKNHQVKNVSGEEFSWH